ncbi:MAG TPA: CUAEP/CCAEP-tail radical SAM protein [Acidimicrobiia bacterium]|nr:CUAEP/CCAEP-tail radical SAM protein [Acidimicrobiia bacterium]
MARLLLISTYELGHQPLHLASPAAALRSAGHEVRCLDLSVEDFDEGASAWADGVAFSVPMHTAMRLAVPVAERVRAERPDVSVAFYGLYAAVGSDRTVGSLADRAVAGEYQPGLLAWASELGDGQRPSPTVIRDVANGTFLPPDRSSLPPLDRYARLAVDGELRLAGYVEASHGCRHRCAHCPIPVVYDGRFRVVQPEVVLEDVAQLVQMGARHITLGDPDFLNGPAHARRVLHQAHSAFPDLTWDVTVKVEHVLASRDIWPELRSLGVFFVVSAFECVDDATLALLDKGHTIADMAEACQVLADAGIAVRPSWLPFTPWTDPSSLEALVGFLDTNRLWGAIDPIQLTIRLLIPDGSLVLGIPGIDDILRGYHPEELGHRWVSPRPEMDRLQLHLTGLVDRAEGAGQDPIETMAEIRSEIGSAMGLRVGAFPDVPTAVPRLTESWFCCSEPASWDPGRLAATIPA